MTVEVATIVVAAIGVMIAFATLVVKIIEVARHK